MELQVSDTICRLVGDDVDAIALRALESLQLNPSTRSGLYTITLATRLELKTIDRTKLPKSYDDVGRIHPFGVGGDVENGPFYVVVIWAAGQLLRKKLGLPPRHFHIMLSDSDNSDDEVAAEKGIDTLLPGQFPASLSKDLLDHFTFTLLAFGQYDRAMPFCVELILASRESYRGFLRYADIALKVRSYKLSMLSYAATFQRADEYSIKEYCIKKMIQCSVHTEWGSVFKEGEILGLPQPILPLLCSSWTEELRCRLSSATLAPILCLESRERLFSLKNIEDSVNLESNFQKLPRFFCWLIPFHFAIMSTPHEESDIATLASPHLGIRHILTLTEETPIPKQWLSGNNIKHTYLPIPNYHPPTIEQMDFIIRLFQEEHNLPLLVHCGGGKGRAGTVAACYLSAYGFGKPQADLTQPTIPASDAVAALRVIRPGSIETPQQEAFVPQWASAIWKRRCIIPPLPEEPLSCPPDIEGELGPENDLFVLVGLPGSGKSWFSQALMARNPKGWTHISQDESGSRSFSESEIGRASGRVLLDRCNSSADDRRIWLKLASWAVKPVCIYFEYDPNLCISRAQNRANHPTLPPGNRVRNAVDQMQKSFVKPSLGEGFKAIATIRSFAASREIVMLLSPAISLFKYPRTPHLLNLGAATDDDLISQSSAPPTDGHIVITEKVDGANMGISLSSKHQIMVQNRAHYVNTSTHEQFKKLGLWIDRHREELHEILNRDDFFPERFILFGEWLSATHSIPYTHLPDRFLVFDFYDRQTGAFADRKSLQRILSRTSIQMVPVILEGRMPGDEELRELVQKRSSYYDGRMEGVYLKVEKNGRVVSRGKFVRGDFIPGNEHWTRGNLRVNGMTAEDI